MLFLKAIQNKIVQVLKNFYRKKRSIRYRLIDVKSVSNYSEVYLDVIVDGIKKQILTFKPEEIIFDDVLLSEFSAQDIRVC